MTLNKLASLICKREGKKVQVSIGNSREIVGILSDILYKEYARKKQATYFTLLHNGHRRHLKVMKTKRGSK